MTGLIQISVKKGKEGRNEKKRMKKDKAANINVVIRVLGKKELVTN
jgi:hypothetical protein